jgi:predicted dehydrogenase
MERVGFGVIGAGLFGENHAVVYSRLPGVELVAVCDQNEERAREVAERYGARAYYTDYEKVLADPEITAVSIATPDFAHAEIALAAAQVGKHILCEKPLATTVEEAQAIVDAAARAGVKLMVDFHNRVNPPFAAAREQVRSGAIGTPAYGYARLSNTTFVPLEMLSWANRTSALYFLGSHAVDIMRSS